MNFLLLMIGILCHGSPRNLLTACEEGVRSAYGVLIQFPSSGGIFMVAGQPLGEAALNVGLEANKFVTAFTVGETISNIIQPFWAIPLLGIAGLKMKDIMGYCIIFFVVLTLIFFGVWAIMW